MDTMKVKLPASGGGGFNHYIGEAFGGGVIFHLWKDAGGDEHGLIVATTDTSSSAAWSNLTTIEIGTAQSTWDGLNNSYAIFGQSGHNSSAAKLCLDSGSGGQMDWYLPAIDELSLLYQNRFNVNKTLSTLSGATQLGYAHYWSSTEYDATSAWDFLFFNGSTNYSSKITTLSVRAIRAF